jgi:CpXC protein
MSIFNRLSAQCPNCGTEQTIELVASVNADRRPDLREQILRQEFQARTCVSCSASFRLPPRFTYQHFAAQQWILVHPRADLANWRALDAEAAEIFAANYGPGTSPMAEEIGREISPRVVFGWPALREKLVSRELGLDDVTLELLKIAMLRTIPDPPYADARELRLTGGDADILRLSWIEAESEERLASVDMDRGIYDDIAGDPGGWSALRTDLTGHLFVDLKRLIFA